jgi:hypothetical protein
MADVFYTSAKKSLGNGTIDWDTDTIKVMLLTSGYTPNAAHDFRDDLGANEVSGTGYTAGGATLANKAVNISGTTAQYDADDVTWASSTITNARYAAIYKSRGGASSADDLIQLVDFGSDKSSSNGPFTIQWNASGIFTIG